MACTVVHGWVPDEEAKDCMACNKSFTTIRRRVRELHRHTHTHSLSLSLSHSTIVVSVVECSVELAVLRGFHYWSKATVTLCVSVSAVTLFSPKTIAASDIITHQYFIVLYTVCVCVCNNNSNSNSSTQ